MIDFINRKDERDLFKKYLEKIQGKNLIIVYGDMGVGKSELVKQILLSYRKYPAIKVKISHKNEFEAGYYLGKIKSYSEHPINGIKFNFDSNHYLIKSKHFLLLKKMLFSILEEIPYLSAIFKIVNKTFKEYLNIKEALSEPSSKNNSILMEKYLNALYGDTPFILDIENIQTIDTCSWERLYSILWNTDNFCLILEYTANTSKNLELSTIIEKFKNIIDDKNIKLIHLTKLKDEHVIKIKPNLSNAEKRTLISLLKDWDGNIKEIENFLYFNKYNCKIKLAENTKYIIDTLHRDELKWLVYIYLSIEEFSFQEWIKIGLPKTVFKILIDSHLIKVENNFVAIDHDTICSILDDVEYIDFKNDAIIFWKKYYKEGYHKHDSQVIYKSLHFTILENNINDLNTLLASIRQYIISSADPIDYLKKIERVYYQNATYSQNTIAMDTLLFWLTELYQNLGNYKKAFTFFNYITDKSNNNYLMLKALLLYQVGFQENAVTYCTELIDGGKITERMELFARIIRLEANYTLEEPDKVNEDYMYIYQNSTKFEKYLEYGFFLRNSEFVKTPLNIIEDLKKSIVHFEKFNANKQAVSSRITLGVYYSLLGNYKQAEYQFKIADSKKEEFVGLYDMILTNQAVLMQYQGTLEGIKEKLTLAQKYAYYDFNKLAIAINLLVYNIRTQKEDEMLIENILSLIENRTFKNKRIICYAYINLYNYYKNKDDKLSSFYFKKIFDLSPLPYYIKEWIYEPVLTPEDPEYYRTRIKWPLNFLDEWSIEFDSSLMSY